MKRLLSFVAVPLFAFSLAGPTVEAAPLAPTGNIVPTVQAAGPQHDISTQQVQKKKKKRTKKRRTTHQAQHPTR